MQVQYDFVSWVCILISILLLVVVTVKYPRVDAAFVPFAARQQRITHAHILPVNKQTDDEPCCDERSRPNAEPPEEQEHWRRRRVMKAAVWNSILFLSAGVPNNRVAVATTPVPEDSDAWSSQFQKDPDDKWTGTCLPVWSVADAAATMSKNSESDVFAMARWPDPVLRRPASKVTQFDQNLVQVARQVERTARQEKAVGLAAQQCGIDASLVVVPSSKQVLVNPRIVARSPEMEMRIWTEYCLVLPPTITATVLRDESIVVEYETLEGNTQLLHAKSELARCLQHEMDHDRGILILDHLPLEDLPEEMQRIERIGHLQRMQLAYDRNIEESTISFHRLG
eukprot:CAMPEP_0198305266 /NCGR_PEP_ID=MMETSP1449-20131203/57822_1 /TAXON_ID=420275 /ORGANISM="Attheya septentrionalis, Strain CCMP2084" /LENGTH=339 /DNA_ID=CAMNT_0044007799 /DNA_START=1409 /DNA_END=2428 /DNA_ORIENTATION=+